MISDLIDSTPLKTNPVIHPCEFAINLKPVFTSKTKKSLLEVKFIFHDTGSNIKDNASNYPKLPVFSGESLFKSQKTKKGITVCYTLL
jgi:hypothetical protein